MDENHKPIKIKLPLLIVIGAGLVLLLVIIVLILVTGKGKSNNRNESNKTSIPPTNTVTITVVKQVNNQQDGQIITPKQKLISYKEMLAMTPTPNPNKVIMKVGEAYLYQSELDPIIKNYKEARLNDKEIKKKEVEAIEYMKKEVSYLQCAVKQNLIGPIDFDKNRFNSKQRNELVDKVKESVRKKLRRSQGEILSIWYNNGYNVQTIFTAKKKMTEEQRKKIALDKLSKLHEKAKNGKSMKDLAKEIENDANLINIDHNYKNNAYYSFDSRKDFINNRESISKNLNEKIWQEDVGGITEIVDDGVSYRFAKVTKKEDGYKNFDDWYNNSCNTEKYEE